MDEKKFEYRVKEWFRQSPARHRNELIRNAEFVVLEVERGTEVTEEGETGEGGTGGAEELRANNILRS